MRSGAPERGRSTERAMTESSGRIRSDAGGRDDRGATVTACSAGLAASSRTAAVGLRGASGQLSTFVTRGEVVAL